MPRGDTTKYENRLQYLSPLTSILSPRGEEVKRGSLYPLKGGD
jgi:hypothetical protein